MKCSCGYQDTKANVEFHIEYQRALAMSARNNDRRAPTHRIVSKVQ